MPCRARNPDIKQLSFVQKDDFLGLMRPLYVMAATSPLILISNAPMSSTSHVRAPLYAIVHVSDSMRSFQKEMSDSNIFKTVGVPGLKTNAERRNIEHSIARLVLDMAVHGPRIFETRISEIHALCKTTLAQSNKAWVGPPPQISNGNTNAENEGKIISSKKKGV